MKTMYYGNEFYVFTYQDYSDVRLVAAPPESVGKYGGDTDNWMWPRHTGDFSMVRIYADADNNPADYSADNVPYHPQAPPQGQHGGCPKRRLHHDHGLPWQHGPLPEQLGRRAGHQPLQPRAWWRCATSSLKTMKSHMDADKAVRIKYAAKYAQTANYWKYYIGQTKGLKRLEVQAQKQKLEALFNRWVNEDEGRKAEYGEALDLIADYYAETDAAPCAADVYALEAGLIGQRHCPVWPSCGSRRNRNV